MSKKLWIGTAMLALLLALVPSREIRANAPESLVVFINGYGVQGKALWYKGKIYVPLEDIALSTGGTYSYDAPTATARATVGTPAQVRPEKAERPYLKVVWERKYTSSNNAKVMATIANQGAVPADNVQVICIFKDATLQELTAQAQDIGRLTPGESRTVEFQLFADTEAYYDPYYAYS